MTNVVREQEIQKLTLELQSLNVQKDRDQYHRKLGKMLTLIRECLVETNQITEEKLKTLKARREEATSMRVSRELLEALNDLIWSTGAEILGIEESIKDTDLKILRLNKLLEK